MTTSPDGELVAVETRLAEIKDRYGEGSIVYQFIQLAEPELVGAVRHVEARLVGE